MPGRDSYGDYNSKIPDMLIQRILENGAFSTSAISNVSAGHGIAGLALLIDGIIVRPEEQVKKLACEGIAKKIVDTRDSGVEDAVRLIKHIIGGSEKRVRRWAADHYCKNLGEMLAALADTNDAQVRILFTIIERDPRKKVRSVAAKELMAPFQQIEPLDALRKISSLLRKEGSSQTIKSIAKQTIPHLLTRIPENGGLIFLDGLQELKCREEVEIYHPIVTDLRFKQDVRKAVLELLGKSDFFEAFQMLQQCLNLEEPLLRVTIYEHAKEAIGSEECGGIAEEILVMGILKETEDLRVRVELIGWLGENGSLIALEALEGLDVTNERWDWIEDVEKRADEKQRFMRKVGQAAKELTIKRGTRITDQVENAGMLGKDVPEMETVPPEAVESIADGMYQVKGGGKPNREGTKELLRRYLKRKGVMRGGAASRQGDSERPEKRVVRQPAAKKQPK